MPWSSGSPRAPRNVASVARRGAGRRPSTPCAMAETSRPEMRTMPTPPRPGGVAIATITSAAVPERTIREA